MTTILVLGIFGTFCFCTGLGFRMVLSGASAVMSPGPVSATPTGEPAPPAPTPLPEATDTPSPMPTPTSEVIIHTVVSGETLGGIAVKYGVSVEAIMEANGLTDAGYIRAGQELIIPLGAP